MNKRPLFRGVFLTLLLLTVSSFAVAQTAATPDISFTIAMSRPHTHLFDIEVAIKRPASGPQQEQLVLPVWTPGSYLVREFARHVQDFNATDSAGQQLKW